MRIRLAPLIAAALTIGILPAVAEEVPVVTAITPDEVKTAPDFSSSRRGYFWDFEDETHYSVEESWPGWQSRALVNGWFEGTVGSSSAEPEILLNNINIEDDTTQPGLQPTNPEPSEFVGAPFDPAYHWLTVRLCAATASSLRVLWFRDLPITDGGYGGTGWVPYDAGCRFVQIDLGAASVGDTDWGDGGLTALELRFPPTTPPGTVVRVDYVALTKRKSGTPITIQWDGPEPVRFYVTRDPGGADITRLRPNRTGGSWTWYSDVLEPGTWYVGAIFNGVQPPSGSFVVNGPPVGTILSPSYTSGPDYATTEFGDPWDMSQAGSAIDDDSDVILPRNLDDMTFVDGVFSAVNVADQGTANDPTFSLPLKAEPADDDIPIDTDAYRYLTYRMWVEGDGVLQGTGGVFRFYFWRGAVRSFTEDLRIYKGWRTVTIDLYQAFLENDDAGVWPGGDPVTKIRMDIHESTDPRPFHVDWIMLTGPTVADLRHDIAYTITDPEDDPVTLTFFWDTDRDLAGRIRIRCTDTSPAGMCRWRTAPVEPGEYYIHMRMRDAAGNFSWVTSETPLVVSH